MYQFVLQYLGTDHLSLLSVHVSSNTVYDVGLREFGSSTVVHIGIQHPERDGERERERDGGQGNEM